LRVKVGDKTLDVSEPLSKGMALREGCWFLITAFVELTWEGDKNLFKAYLRVDDSVYFNILETSGPPSGALRCLMASYQIGGKCELDSSPSTTSRPTVNSLHGLVNDFKVIRSPISQLDIDRALGAPPDFPPSSPSLALPLAHALTSCEQLYQWEESSLNWSDAHRASVPLSKGRQFREFPNDKCQLMVCHDMAGSSHRSSCKN
jgi:hypothetical protein